jgi:hypothetical protein
VWRLRPFENTDTPALARIWSEHHAGWIEAAECSAGLWDQCVLCKPFFVADELLLAFQDDGLPQGLIHFGASLTDDGSRASTECGMIHRLCVIPQPDEPAIAAALIERALDAMRERGMHRCRAIGAPTTSSFYLGVAEGDNLLGVLARDARMRSWLTTAGFQPATPTVQWSVQLETFRPPMDRTQIAIRRSCTISRLLDDYPSHWWLSNILGHCDQSRFHLRSRGPEPMEMELMLWTPDATIRGVDSSTVRFFMPPVPADDENRERLVYLIAESLRQLQSERSKRQVRVATTSSDTASARVLQRLGFATHEHGLVFERDFASHASSTSE